MKSPAATLHELAGSPAQPGCEEAAATCEVCSWSCTRTRDYVRWQGANFTDQNKLRGHALSGRICEPCVWAHSWTAPPGFIVSPDKKRGPNLRMFWHAFSSGSGYVYGNKADKVTLQSWLRARDRDREAPWFCAVADSGKKHVLPWARWQYGPSGTVKFEELDVALGDWRLCDDMESLLQLGARKCELDSGRWSPRSWNVFCTEIKAFEAKWRLQRSGAWWSLALWLARMPDVRR